MGEKSKNILIGLFVISTCIITLWLLLFLRPSYGDKKQILRVRFSSIEKVSVGTKVTFAGKPIGQVKSINYIYDAREEKRPTSRVYFYELELAIDSHIKIYSSDDIMIHTSGLLGEKIIAIIPKHRVGEAAGHLIPAGEVVYAATAGPMAVEEALHQVVSLAKKMEKSMDQVFLLMENEKLWKNLEAMITNITNISSALNKQEDLQEIVHNLSITSKNSKEITDKINQFITKTEEGKGTIGELFTTNDFYLRIVSITDKINTLMNDINHYGLLFHLDKGWQRMRTKRINILSKLKTPNEFRNYFEEELDQINTSLSRVSGLLSIVEKSPEKNLLKEDEFSKSFAELLSRVQLLEDSLSLYNQQFFENQDKNPNDANE